MAFMGTSACAYNVGTHTHKSSLYFLISLNEYYTVSGFISLKILSLYPSLVFENDLLKKSNESGVILTPGSGLECDFLLSVCGRLVMRCRILTRLRHCCEFCL